VKDLINKLNKAFDNKIRLGIMSVLIVNQTASFKELKEELGVTDGNLASHLKALEQVGYILVIKSFINRKPFTQYQITKEGISAFKNHLDVLEKILKSNKP
jgi:DNA-binding MarR family transcriptional regulator